MPRAISRRDFIYAGAVGGTAIAAGIAAERSGQAVQAGGLGGGTTKVVARRSGSISGDIRDCVNALSGGSGIGAFVQPGQKVAVKVNASWAYNHEPENPSVSPEVVRQVVILVKSAGPSKITVFDKTLDGDMYHPITDIADAARSAGAQVIIERNPSQSKFVSKSLSGAVLKATKVWKVLDEADVLINVPKLKHHGGAGVTISLKNHLGSIYDRGAVHGAGIQQGIADLNTCSSIRGKHRLTICDAIRPMVNNGPKWGPCVHYGGILAGTDPVAVDVIGTEILRKLPGNTVPANPSHIAKAAALGLGTSNRSSILFDEHPAYGEPVPEVPLSYVLAGAAAAGLAARFGGGCPGRGPGRGPRSP